MAFQQVAIWALTGSTGMSSKAIALHLLGLESDGSYPRDGGDFARCEGLLDAVPTFRARIGEMAEVNAYWAALAPKWEEIRVAADKSAAIAAIVRPIQDQDPRVVRLGPGVTMTLKA